MKDTSVEDKLRNLYELQEIDSKLSQIEILKGELPMEVEALESDIRSLEKRIDKVENKLGNLDKDIAAQNNKAKEAKALVERYETQMENVKNNREYEALSRELELQSLEIRVAEKKVNEIRFAKQKQEESLEVLNTRLATKKSDLEIKKVELEEIVSKTEKDEKKLKRQSNKARKDIEPRLLESYDRVRNAYRNGLAVVSVERDSCGGCFNYVPPQTRLEIGLRKKFITCDHCGRVLVDDKIMSPLEESMTK